MKKRLSLKLIILFMLLIIFIIVSIYMEMAFIPKMKEEFQINIFSILYEFFKLPIFTTLIISISLMVSFKNDIINFSKKSKIYNSIALVFIFAIYLLIVFNYFKIPYFNVLFTYQREIVQIILFIPFGICFYKLIK